MIKARKRISVTIILMLLLSGAYSMISSIQAGASSAPAEELVAVSNDQLWTREPTQIGGNWTHIGNAYVGELNSVRAMAYTNGSLWAVTRFNRLLVRDPVADAPWNDVGHANDVKALTAIGDWLYAITGDNQLWTRQNLRYEVNWTPLKMLNVDVVAMSAWQGGLVVATTNNQLIRIDPISGATMATIGSSAAHATTLTAANGSLFATTTLNRLMEYDLVYDTWYDIGHANYVVAMTTVTS